MDNQKWNCDNITDEEKHKQAKEIRRLMNRCNSFVKYNNKNKITKDDLMDIKTKNVIENISNNIANSIRDSLIEFYENVKLNDKMLEIEKIQNDKENNIFQNLIQSQKYRFDSTDYTVVTNLSNVLERYGLKQKSLVDATGINRGTISNLIKNPESANLLNVLKVCAVLGIKVEELFELRETLVVNIETNEDMNRLLKNMKILSEDKI